MTKIGFAFVNEVVCCRESWLNLRSSTRLDPECNGEASVAKQVSGHRYIAVTMESCLRCYVQPRNKNIRIKIGIGMPKSQSKMYPVAPACSIFRPKRITSSPSRVNRTELWMCVSLADLLCCDRSAPYEPHEVSARLQTRRSVSALNGVSGGS